MLILDKMPASVGAQTRVVRGLRRVCLETPEGDKAKARPGKSSAAARKGLSYEAKVGRFLAGLAAAREIAGLRAHPWINFEDTNGFGRAQPDYIFWQKTKLLVCEVKLSETDDAWRQLEKLYVPLLERIFPESQVVPVQVVHNLIGSARPIKEGLAELEAGTVWFLPTV